MKYLSDIVSNLNQKIVDGLWMYYQSKKYLKADTRQSLLKAIVEKKDFHPSSSSSLSHLKRKLKSDLYNTILSQSEESIYKTHFAQLELKVKKAIVVIEVLAAKGAFLEAVRSINEQLKLAEKYELYEQQVQFLELQIDLLAFSRKSFDLRGAFEKLSAAQGLRDKLLQAKKENYLALLEEHYKDTSNEENICKHLSRLKQLSEETKSVRIEMIYRLVLMRYHDNQKDYEKALSAAISMQGLIVNSKILSSNANISRICSEIARFQMIFQEFEESKKYTLESLRYANVKSQSGLMSIETVFKLSLFTNELHMASEYLSKGIHHEKVKRDVSFRAKWSYFEACQLFAEKKFIAAQSVLKIYLEKHGVAFDQEGWAFGVRLIYIMILIELKDVDKADLEIRNMHYQLKEVEELVKRTEIILNTLDYIKKNDFEFKTTERLKQFVFELKEGNWDPLSFELINFTEWLEGKMK